MAPVATIKPGRQPSHASLLFLIRFNAARKELKSLASRVRFFTLAKSTLIGGDL